MPYITEKKIENLVSDELFCEKMDELIEAISGESADAIVVPARKKNIENVVADEDFNIKMDKLIAALGGGGGITPTGTISITENGTYNVKTYASAEVNVSGGSTTKTFNVSIPAGTIITVGSSGGSNGGISAHAINGDIIGYISWNSADVAEGEYVIEEAQTWNNTAELVFECAGIQGGSDTPSNASLSIQVNGDTYSTTIYPYENIDGWRWGLLNAEQYHRDNGIELNTLLINGGSCTATCVAADTLVMCPDAVKEIKDITKFDKVLAMNPATMQPEYAQVTQVFKKLVTAPTETYTFSDGSQLQVINNHRIYHKETNSMQYIQNFAIGEHTVNLNNEFIALVSKEVSEPVEQNIYFLANKYHNFYSNNIISGDQATKPMHFGA